MPGTGAAGGVGFAALAVLAAIPAPGIDLVLELAGFPAKLERADLVITGEGSLDAQTLQGKGPAGVAAAAAALGLPVVAVAGRVLPDRSQLRSAGFTATYALRDIEPDPAVCMSAAGAARADHSCGTVCVGGYNAVWPDPHTRPVERPSAGVPVGAVAAGRLPAAQLLPVEGRSLAAGGNVCQATGIDDQGR